MTRQHEVKVVPPHEGKKEEVSEGSESFRGDVGW